eukprot:gene6067-6305_t
MPGATLALFTSLTRTALPCPALPCPACRCVSLPFNSNRAISWQPLAVNKYYSYKGLDVASLCGSYDGNTLVYVVKDLPGKFFDMPNLSMIYKVSAGAAPVQLRNWGYYTAVACADADCSKVIAAADSAVADPLSEEAAAEKQPSAGGQLWVLDTTTVAADPLKSWQLLVGSPVGRWSDLSTSVFSNGDIITAVQNPGHIFISTDAGKTFVQKLGDAERQWLAVAMSADGNRQLAAAAGDNPAGGLYLSTDSGATWSKVATGVATVKEGWQDVAVSSEGQHMAAVQGGGVYLSNDGGKTWVRQSTGSTAEQPSSAAKFLSVACSDDCKTVVAGEELLWVTNDSGKTWSTLKK